MSRYFAGDVSADEAQAAALAALYGGNSSAHYAASLPENQQEAAEPASSGGFLSAIADIFKSVATGTVAVTSVINRPLPQYTDIYGRPAAPPGVAPTQPVSTTPVWLVPAAIGGGVLVLLLVLKSRRSSVAGYRRRKHRRSRR